MDTSVAGCPVNVDGYLLWYSPVSEGPYYFLGFTTDTSYVHPGVAQFAEGMFYYGETYAGPVGVLANLPQGGSHLTHEQVSAMLNSQR